MEQDLDVVIFGSSGYTGFFVIGELLTAVHRDKLAIRWALAGRNLEKTKTFLKDAIKDVGATDLNVDDVEIIVADANDKESLLNMAKRAKIVLNCVGPYRHFGRQVVEACVESGASHLDISGEPLYMEDIQLKYFKIAEEKGIHIISACGFDSIPNDMGINFLQSSFDGTVNTVETFIHGSLEDGGKPRANSTTWDCVVDGVSDQQTLKVVRKELFTKIFSDVSKFRPKHGLERKSFFKHADAVEAGYALPFPGSDRSVAKRSQLHSYDYFKQRPIESESYIVFPSAFAVFFAFIVGMFLTVFSKFQYGRHLLHKYPELFTLGVFVKGGPSREETEKTRVTMIFVGRGWAEQLTDPLDQRSDPPNKTLTVSVSIKNPGYRSTAAMLVQSCITLLLEKDKLPAKGGVWTPGVAFKKTSLIDRLQSRGIEFKVLS